MVSTAVAATFSTIGGILGLAIIAWPIGIWYEVDVKCERPKYKLLRTLGTRKRWLGLFGTTHAVEIREYAPYLFAEVTCDGSDGMRHALGQGFRAIAGFIFGKNRAPGGEGSQAVAMTSPVTLEMAQPPSAKIPMTSPVAAEMAADGAYKVSFIMPSQYKKETLPQPLNERVQIKEMRERTLAALTWNGRSPEEGEVERRRAQLVALLKQAGLEPTGPLHLWQYHPPFAPNWQRVNEVLLEVNTKGSAAAVQASTS